MQFSLAEKVAIRLLARRINLDIDASWILLRRPG
jgi:hypothetical protein